MSRWFAGVLCLVLFSTVGCGQRKPTLDELTYYEAAQLVLSEQERLAEIREVYRSLPTGDAEEPRIREAMEKQARRLDIAIDIRDAAWENEKHLAPDK